jgi:hypothetical protein
VQNNHCRLSSSTSSPHDQTRQHTIEEIAVKKSVRVKHKECGKPGEIVRAMLIRDGDRSLWIDTSGEEPTEGDVDLVQEWPKDKQRRVVRQLEVSTDGFVDDMGHYECATVYKVVEKRGAAG